MDVTYESQTTNDRGRSRSRSRSRSLTRSRRVRGRYGPPPVLRIARPFRPSGIKDFSFMYQPFNMTIQHGTGGGINFYADQSLPGVVAPFDAANGAYFAFAFSLNSIITLINGNTAGNPANSGTSPNVDVLQYVNLFDSYRIRSIELRMVYNASDQTQTMTTGLPNILMVNDYDDRGRTAQPSLLQYDSLRILQMQGGKQQIWRVKPKLQTAVETLGGTTVAMTPPAGAWIDTLSPDAMYYGVKGMVDLQNLTGTLTSTGYITFYVKCNVQFKNTK